MLCTDILWISMNHTLAECARWLEKHEEPGEVIRMLMSLHPSSSSKNVRRVRRGWVQEYGAGHNDGAIRKDLRRVLQVIKSEASVAKKEGGQRKSTKQPKTAADRVGVLSKMDLLGEWSARNTIQSRKESFTGLVEIDELLR